MIENSELILSILIPTYNYKKGLIRLLDNFDDLPQGKYEIIVYDNSPNEEIHNYMDIWIKEHPHINITYKLNRPITEAPLNWNNLIDASKGKYILLLHNGEVPAESQFFKKLIDKLENDKPDVALVNCILVDIKSKNAFYHLPFFLKSLVIKKFQAYIFRQNVIGPTSTLVAKKYLYAKFDENLKWLLDVDSYYQTLKISTDIKTYKNLSMLSIQENNETLTAQLGDEIEQTEKRERKYLNSKYKNIFWNETVKSSSSSIIKKIENILWKILIKFYMGFRSNLNIELKHSLEKIWSSR